MRKHWLLAGVLAMVGTLCLADIANAQLFRRGRGGYFSNRYYDGYYGNRYSGDTYYDDQSGLTPRTGGFSRSFYPPVYDDAGQFNQQGLRQGGLRQDDRQAHVLIRLPAADAQVWFDDHRTQQEGMQRLFDTPPLESGTYSYKIRAKWRQNDKDMERTRTVRIQPGKTVTVDFSRSNTGQQGEQIDQPRRRNQSDQPNQNRSTDSPRNNNQNPDQPQQRKPNPRQNPDTN
jgi:uncharacterized protein (TIGR03000 family)